ncbi:MAG TPA: TatD family hydrolase, partial [Pseudomonadales bacterium]|nr:TatD family hydrolase [Pseudomonadales bacterium]
QQLELAIQFNKPVLLHVRRAHAETLRWLKYFKLPRAGIIHAFAGSNEEAKEYAKLGFKLGIGGAFTHERAQRLRKTLQQLPAEQIVLETDAPDMAPAFALGQRNSPTHLDKIAELLAELRGETVTDLAHYTTENALSILRA